MRSLRQVRWGSSSVGGVSWFMTVEVEEVVVLDVLEDLEKPLRVLEEEDHGWFWRC